MISDLQLKECTTRPNVVCSKLSSISNLSDILYRNSFVDCPSDDDRSDQRAHDDTLTSLNWLNNLSIPITNSHIPNEDNLPLNNSSVNANSFSIETSNSNRNIDRNFFQFIPNKLQAALRSEGLFDPIIRHEYKHTWKNKPPFSYTTLICMAMLELGKPKIALYEIYQWIRDNFLFYRKPGSSWQNSVRHNLSLKKCFEKVPRRKDERGKGGFWRINPNFTDNLGSNLIKYRRQFQIYDLPQYSQQDSFYNMNVRPVDNEWRNVDCVTDCRTALIKQTIRVDQYPCNNSDVSQEKMILKPLIKSHSKPVFKKPYALSSLNQFETIEENEKVVAQMRLCGSPRSSSPILSSLTHSEPLLSEISSNNSNYSAFGFEDFDSNTSSSFDTDFSCSSNFHTSSDESYSLSLGLDIDELLPPH